MWFLNKRTGVKWDVDAVTAKRVSNDPNFEPCEPPDEVEQDPGGSVLHTELSGLDMPAQPPGGTDSNPSPTPREPESSTDDEGHKKNGTTQPDPQTGSAPKRASKARKRSGV